MKLFLIMFVVFVSSCASSPKGSLARVPTNVEGLVKSSTSKDELAKAANDNPFLNGQLNPEYEGQLTALAGEVIQIKSTRQNFSVYKLKLRIEGVDPIWVTSIAPAPGGEIKLGDKIIFKGYITTAKGTDPTGELELLIQAKTLLMAIQSQRP